MSKTENCPPWKRRKLEQQSIDETKTISNRVPKFEKWIPFNQNPAIAELDEDEKETRVLCRTVTGILNKLTWANFDQLSDEIFNLQIDTSRKIQLIVDMIHKRGVTESKHRILYVKMCGILTYSQVVHKRDSIQSFLECLASKCEEFFTQSLHMDSVLNERKRGIDSCVDVNLRKTLLEACKLEESMCRKKSVGNCEFTGELFKLNMITSEMIIYMLDRLSSATLFMAVECVCTIITTVGLFYEEKIGKLPEKYFSDSEYVLKSDNVPVWVRFPIQEMLDLRNRSWGLKKTIERVQDEAQSQQITPETIPQKEYVQESEYNQYSVGLQRVEPATIPIEQPNQELMVYQEPVQPPPVMAAPIPLNEHMQRAQIPQIQPHLYQPATIPQMEPNRELLIYQEPAPPPQMPAPISLNEHMQRAQIPQMQPHLYQPGTIPQMEPNRDLMIYQEPAPPPQMPAPISLNEHMQRAQIPQMQPHLFQPGTIPQMEPNRGLMIYQEPIQRPPMPVPISLNEHIQRPEIPQIRPHLFQRTTIPQMEPNRDLMIYQEPVQHPQMPAPISHHEHIQRTEIPQIHPHLVQPATIPQMDPIQEVEMNQSLPQTAEPATAPPQEPVQELEINQDQIQSEALLESRICEALEIELKLPFVDVHQFEQVADAVLQKVTCEPDNCQLYAELCNHVWKYSVLNEEGGSTKTEFKNVILHKCHQLLDKLKTEELPNEENEQLSTSFKEIKNDISQKVVGIARFIVELFRLHKLTPETIYRLSSKLIEFKSSDLFIVLRNLLPINAKPILSKMKKQRRIVEMFQFFDKLDLAMQGVKYRHQRRFAPKTALRQFIYGADAETVIQEIVMNDPIPPLKEFTPPTLFLYLRTFFNQLRPEEHEPPQWVVSKRSMFSSNKAVPEAIKQLLTTEMLKTNPTADRSGRFFVKLIKWSIISAQDVIDGISGFLCRGIYEKIRKHLKTLSSHLFESGLFNGDNLMVVSPEHLDLIPAVENRWKYVDDAEISPIVENFPNLEALQVDQSLSSSKAIAADLIKKAFTSLTPYSFNPVEFKAQLNHIFKRVEHLNLAASCLIQLVIKNPNLYGFYIKICCPILKLTIDEKEFWEVLLISCNSYFDQFCFQKNNSFIEKTPISKNRKRRAAKKSITEQPSSANAQPCNNLQSPIPMTVEVTGSSKRKTGRYQIEVPGKAYSVMNQFNESMDSTCPTCGSIMDQLDKIKRKITYCKELIAQLQKKVSISQVGKKAIIGKSLKKGSGGRCTVYMAEEIYHAMKTKTDFYLELRCDSCNCTNRPWSAICSPLKVKMKQLDELMACVYAQVDFKPNQYPVLEKVKKKVQDKRISLCRFVSMLVNVLNNETADTSVKRLMQKLLIASQIELFCEIYLHLEWKEARFEKSVFNSKIPEILSNNKLLKIENRKMLEGVLKDFANGGAHRIITKSNHFQFVEDQIIQRVDWSEMEYENPQKSVSPDPQNLITESNTESSDEENIEKDIEDPLQ